MWPGFSALVSEKQKCFPDNLQNSLLLIVVLRHRSLLYIRTTVSTGPSRSSPPCAFKASALVRLRSSEAQRTETIESCPERLFVNRA